MSHERFMSCFNRLVAGLEVFTGSDRRQPFYRLLEEASRKSSLIRQNLSLLQEFGDLRNAMVHYDRYPRELIAAPTAEASARFEAIVDCFLDPPNLERFIKPICIFGNADALNSAMGYMKENDFSQVVVDDRRASKILSTDGIIAWLLESYERDLLSLKDTKISDLIDYEPSRSHAYISRNASFADVEEIFSNAASGTNTRLFGVLITHNGRANEKVLGIVTPWDLNPSNKLS